jgi:hypothetical protein
MNYSRSVRNHLVPVQRAIRMCIIIVYDLTYLPTNSYQSRFTVVPHNAVGLQLVCVSGNIMNNTSTFQRQIMTIQRSPTWRPLRSPPSTWLKAKKRCQISQSKSRRCTKISQQPILQPRKQPKETKNLIKPCGYFRISLLETTLSEEDAGLDNCFSSSGSR